MPFYKKCIAANSRAISVIIAARDSDPKKGL